MSTEEPDLDMKEYTVHSCRSDWKGFCQQSFHGFISALKGEARHSRPKLVHESNGLVALIGEQRK